MGSLHQQDKRSRDHLSATKRMLLEQRLKKSVSSLVQETTTIDHVAEANSLLSLPQQGIWFMHQWQPENPLYHISVALHISGPLQYDALRKAFQAIVERHAVLRTVIQMQDHQPIQTTRTTVALEIPVVDIQTVPAKQKQEKLEHLLHQDIRIPFDLEQGPLLRTTLFALAPEEHVLLLVVHHIVWDGWSTGVFLKELETYYNALTDINTVSFSPDPLPLQYTDYARWLQQSIKEPAFTSHVQYWRTQLAGDLLPLALPVDRARPSTQTFRGKRCYRSLSPELVQDLRLLSQREDVTLFMTLMTVFQTLLYRYTGQEDILVGSPVANRQPHEVENLIGLFVNMLVLRTHPDGSIPFTTFLQQVRQVALDAYTHQSVPFEWLVNELGVKRDPGYHPFFQTVFVLQNTPSQPAQMRSLALERLDLDMGIAKFDLTFEAIEKNNGMTIAAEYNTDLFDESTINNMLEHFHTLLTAVVQDASQCLNDLPLLTQAEIDILLAGQKQKQHYTTDLCVHQAFEIQAVQHPDAVAVLYAKQKLTYRELSKRSNELAQYILNNGIAPASFIGLYLERSIDIIVAILGVLKAGCAYVPIDPAYPEERRAFMLQDAQIQMLLTQEALKPAFQDVTIPVVCLDADWYLVEQERKKEPPAIPMRNDATAYVIYTSGSTGTPKGVMVSHANILRLFAATQDWFHFSDEDTWTLFHSYAFDFSVWEIWGALLSGGKVVVVPYLISRSPEDFYQLLLEHNVTVLNQTPSAFSQLMQVDAQVPETRLSSLRLIIFGGEALDLQRLRPWFDRYGDDTPQLINMYGITETTVHVTYRRLSSNDLITGKGSVIGEPIDDLYVYVLDPRQHLVPRGVPGELYVGGDGVTKGYLHRPELTAARFVPDPFAADAQHLLYRTGDLVRFTSDGELEYLGRIDHQVKIRGFRIELGEIESQILQHEMVQDVIVLAREDTPGTKQLVAYVVCSTPALSVDEMKRFLKPRLPEYMFPAIWMFLDAFPLTVNGKVDRRALPIPLMTRPQIEQSFVAPTTPVEKILVRIWSSMLGLEQVGVCDNFFALGGDSIRSIQVIAAAKAEQIHFSLQHLFQYQTIRELAQIVSIEAPSSLLASTPIPFSLLDTADRAQLPTGIEDAYPLTQLQLGMLMYSMSHPEGCAYHNVGSYTVQAPFVPDLFNQALEQLTLRHAVLRTSFDLTHYSEPLQLVHNRPAVLFHWQDIRSISAAEQEAILDDWFEHEKQQKFAWSQAPLIRFFVYLRSDTLFQLYITEHHAILDGWSIATLQKELFTLYHALLKQRDAVLPMIRQTFSSFVSVERLAHQSQEQRTYWQHALQDHIKTHLPRQLVPIAEKPGEHFIVDESLLPKHIFPGLNNLARSINIPLKSILLSAHSKVLSILTNQTDIITGVVTNGRIEDVDGEKVTGVFLNTSPFRAVLRPGTWLDLIRAVFSGEQEMSAFRRFPLSDIQQDQGNEPLFECVFNFVHFHIDDDALPAAPIPVTRRNTLTNTNFPFVVECIVHAESSDLQLQFTYDAATFNQEQVQRIRHYYEAVLATMIQDVSALHQDFVALTQEDKQNILMQWAASNLRVLPDVCVHHLFEKQAIATPLAIAVVAGQQQLTYQELDQRSNQLARYLQRSGIAPEKTVGIYMERTLDFVISTLAVLKAGAAYVPIDPTYPQERVHFILQDAHVAWVVSSKRLYDHVPHTWEKTLNLDTQWHLIAQERPEPLQISIDPQQLAYIIYTSGSTGRPKGCAIEHRSLLNLVQWHQQAFAVGAQDRASHLAGLGFDASVWELWPYLTTGASLHLVEDEIRVSAELLQRWLIEHEITHAFLPTPLAENIITFPWPQQGALRILLTGGDQLHLHAQLQLPFRFVNNYGPTENTVVTLSGNVQTEIGAKQLPTLGKPVTNAEVFVLNNDLLPVPPGTPGELYIGGTGLARGYFFQPALTAERFIPHPFRSAYGARLYKTGDIVRFSSDGTLEFIGRSDNQIKIRGFRIEIGEIESVIGQHRAIKECAVLVHEETPADKKLVAYIVPQHHDEIFIDDLRSFVRGTLPDYMVPSAFILLAALPLTPNGKIDRRMLPAPSSLHKEENKNIQEVIPYSNTEREIAFIWQKILHKAHIGIHENFFDLGGTSLLVVQVFNALRSAFPEKDMSLLTLYQYPTIATLSEYLQRHDDVSLPTERDERTEQRSRGKELFQQKKRRLQNMIKESRVDD